METTFLSIRKKSENYQSRHSKNSGKELQIEQGPFTIEELGMVFRNTKKNKTAGLGEIQAVVWKTGHFNHILLEFCNEYTLRKQLNTGRKVASSHSQRRVIAYRGITLTCITAKIFNTLLRERIQPIGYDHQTKSKWFQK